MGEKISIWSPILKFSTATARQSCEDNTSSMLLKQPAPYPQWTATASVNQPIMTEDYYLVEVSHGHHTEKGFGEEKKLCPAEATTFSAWSEVSNLAESATALVWEPVHGSSGCQLLSWWVLFVGQRYALHSDNQMQCVLLAKLIAHITHSKQTHPCALYKWR